MHEYSFADLILDREHHLSPMFVIRYELHGFFADGHEIPRRRFAYEADAKEAVKRIWKENRYGYKFRGQWVDTHLLKCDYIPVQVPALFRPS